MSVKSLKYYISEGFKWALLIFLILCALSFSYNVSQAIKKSNNCQSTQSK